MVTIENKEKDLNKLQHDIRNLRLLTPEQIELIYKLNEKEKIDIILLYDSILSYVNEIINKEDE